MYLVPGAPLEARWDPGRRAAPINTHPGERQPRPRAGWLWAAVARRSRPTGNKEPLASGRCHQAEIGKKLGRSGWRFPLGWRQLRGNSGRRLEKTGKGIQAGWVLKVPPFPNVMPVLSQCFQCWQSSLLFQKLHLHLKKPAARGRGGALKMALPPPRMKRAESQK